MNNQITGTLAGIEQRNAGWVAVSILEPGKQHPKKLSTKKPELIGLAQQLMGQLVTAGYNESESDSINQHTGQPYINRYLEALQMGAVQMQLTAPPMQPQPVQQAYVPQAQPVQQPVFVPQTPVAQTLQQPVTYATSDDVRESRIMRQAAGKVAVALLPLLQPEDQNLASLVRISEQLVKYFRDGVNWQAPPIQPQAQPNPVQQAVQQQYPQDPGPGDYQPPTADDDIPF